MNNIRSLKFCLIEIFSEVTKGNSYRVSKMFLHLIFFLFLKKKILLKLYGDKKISWLAYFYHVQGDVYFA